MKSIKFCSLIFLLAGALAFGQTVAQQVFPMPCTAGKTKVYVKEPVTLGRDQYVNQTWPMAVAGALQGSSDYCQVFNQNQSDEIIVLALDSMESPNVTMTAIFVRNRDSRYDGFSLVHNARDHFTQAAHAVLDQMRALRIRAN